MRIGIPSLTPMVRKIMIVSAAVWLVQVIASFGLGLPLEPWLGLFPVLVVTKGMIWQPVTYIFLHAPGAPFHLIFNMLMLWMFGGELERFWGARAFLRYYLVCGVGAGIFVIVVDLALGYTTLTTGASGALYGIFLAFGLVFSERTILFMLIFPMKARTMALIMCGLTLFYTLTGPYQGGVSHLAHLGGALVGFLYLKRAWRFGEFYKELRWRMLRRKFKVTSKKDDDFDRWVH